MRFISFFMILSRQIIIAQRDWNKNTYEEGQSLASNCFKVMSHVSFYEKAITPFGNQIG